MKERELGVRKREEIFLSLCLGRGGVWGGLWPTLLQGSEEAPLKVGWIWRGDNGMLDDEVFFLFFKAEPFSGAVTPKATSQYGAIDCITTSQYRLIDHVTLLPAASSPTEGRRGRWTRIVPTFCIQS